MDDIVSRILKQSLDTFLLNNPVRTSTGFLLGIVLSSFYPAFAPLIEDIIRVNLSMVPTIGWIALGILLFNVRVPGSKRKISPKAEEAFELIEEARFRGISDIEISQRYRLLIQEYTNNVALNQEMALELEKLKSTQQKETGT